jgi:hypothetical protein
MKFKTIVLILILQLIIILGLFGYFYTQKRDQKKVIYIPIINTEAQKDALYFDINTIQEYAFSGGGYSYMSEAYQVNTNNINVDDIVYITLTQYGGKINGVLQANKEYLEGDKNPIIQGKVMSIKKGNPGLGESTTYTVKYGIEEGEFVANKLAGAVARIELDSQGKAFLRAIYKDKKILYKAGSSL